MKRILPFLIILAVLGGTLGSVWFLTRPVVTPAVPANSPASSNNAQPASAMSELGPIKTGIAGAEPAHTKGPATAAVHIEEFGDFQCPPCAMFHPILEQMEKEFGDKLRVTFRQFPLVPSHRHALIAASASEAAGMQGKFWQMHALIYEHQQDWKDQIDVRPTFEGYAKEIGLNIERYNRDLEGDAVAQRIFNDGKRANSLGVKGTPTVFLNNREVPFTHLPAEKLRVLIQKEIK